MEEDKEIAKRAEIVLIGGSAGSLPVLIQMLPELRLDLAFPIVVIVHRKPFPDSLLAGLLARHTELPVLEVEDKMALCPAHIYLVPPDYHLLFESKEMMALDPSEKVNHSRPAIDVTFQAAAQLYRQRVVALLLSGANADGVEGLQYIKKNGGTVLIQEPATAEIDYMPRKALTEVAVDHILRPEHIAHFINQLGD